MVVQSRGAAMSPARLRGAAFSLGIALATALTPAVAGAGEQAGKGPEAARQPGGAAENPAAAEAMKRARAALEEVVAAAADDRHLRPMDGKAVKVEGDGTGT